MQLLKRAPWRGKFDNTACTTVRGEADHALVRLSLSACPLVRLSCPLRLDGFTGLALLVHVVSLKETRMLPVQV